MMLILIEKKISTLALSAHLAGGKSLTHNSYQLYAWNRCPISKNKLFIQK